MVCHFFDAGEGTAGAERGDAVVSRLILNAIADVAGIDGRVGPGAGGRRECFA